MSIRNYYYSFFEESPPYDYPVYINSEQEVAKHQFPYSQEAEQFTKIFQEDLNGITFSQFLQEQVYDSSSNDRIELLKDRGWEQIGSRDYLGLILSHPDFPNWLIKKNYSFRIEDDRTIINRKKIYYDELPVWMLPNDHKRREDPNDTNNKAYTANIPNGIMNPLRVVVLHRGEECISQLFLDCLEPCKEYVFFLPGAHEEAVLHERVVVLSRKMNIFSTGENIKIFTQIFMASPEYFRRLATQICLFIKYTRMADMHMGNISFVRPENPNDLPRHVTFPDGEPLGSMCDESYLSEDNPNYFPFFNKLDRGAFSLLGLLKFKQSLENKYNRLSKCTQKLERAASRLGSSSDELNDQFNEIANKQRRIVNKQQMLTTFCEIIEAAEKEIIYERRWVSVKTRRFPILWILFFAIACVRAICDCIGFTRMQQQNRQKFRSQT